jgi:hypothetical protein
MITVQASGIAAIAQGRLITQSQWDGSAFLTPEQITRVAPGRSEERVVAQDHVEEGTIPATI